MSKLEIKDDKIVVYSGELKIAEIDISEAAYLLFSYDLMTKGKLKRRYIKNNILLCIDSIVNKFKIGDTVWINKGKYRGHPGLITHVYMGKNYGIDLAIEDHTQGMIYCESMLSRKLRKGMKTDLYDIIAKRH